MDYEDLLNQKRRDEARYRHGQDPHNYGGMKASTSDGVLNRAAPAPNYEAALSKDLEEFSQAVSRVKH